MTDDEMRDYLNTHVEYDPDTGDMYWAGKPRTGIVLGKPIGSLDRHNGYCRVMIKGKMYSLHRLIWFYVHGYWPVVVDHINGVKHDNRIENLRDVEQAFNLLNTPDSRSTSSSSGRCDHYILWLASIASM